MSDTDKKDDDKKNGGIAQKLFEAREILICEAIDQKMASRVVAQLLALAADSDDDITLFLNSQGGHVEAGDSIHDIIRFIKPRVRIIGTGWVASAGTHIFLAVDKEDRMCLPNTRFHPPALRRRGWQGDRYRHSGRADRDHARPSGTDHLRANRPKA